MARWLYIIIVLTVIGIAAYFMLGSSTGYVPGAPSEHVRGSGDITIVEFSDFQCPYCGRAEPTIEQVLADYEGKVKLVYRHFPLPAHQYAQKAAEASECVADQEKFWEYHDILFDNQDALYPAKLKEYAARLGVDAKQFNACLDSGAMASRISADKSLGQSMAVSGTPTFFIGDEKLVGSQPYSAFKAVIERKLP